MKLINKFGGSWFNDLKDVCFLNMFISYLHSYDYWCIGKKHVPKLVFSDLSVFLNRRHGKQFCFEASLQLCGSSLSNRKFES